MKIDKKRVVCLIAIVAILFAAGVVAFHHHNNICIKADNDCKICSFINTVNTAILAVIISFCVIRVFIAMVLMLEIRMLSDIERILSSRAPPQILL
jgi:hypothetical protein